MADPESFGLSYRAEGQSPRVNSGERRPGNRGGHDAYWHDAPLSQLHRLSSWMLAIILVPGSWRRVPVGRSC